MTDEELIELMAWLTVILIVIVMVNVRLAM
jgi:hypothetical protein